MNGCLDLESWYIVLRTSIGTSCLTSCHRRDELTKDTVGDVPALSCSHREFEDPVSSGLQEVWMIRRY